MKKTALSLLLALAFAWNAGAATIYVDAVDNLFHSKYLYVPVGTTVVWTNYGMHTHTVTSNTPLFNSGSLTTGQTFSFTFNTVGDYGYFCTFHPLMTGVVYVRNASNLTFAINLTPVNPPIIIQPGGGLFSYFAQGTNQTANTLSTTYWGKIYPPNNATPFQTIQKGVTIPAGGTRGATLLQNVISTSPPGLYTFVGAVGSNPDSALAWSTFTFTKLASGLDGTGWESVITEDWHDIAGAVMNPISAGFHLNNFPEPFNPTTTISFSLPAAGNVSLEVFNSAGSKVATLANGYRSAGEHRLDFDGSNLASGLYLYRLNAKGQSISQKMMLIK